MGHGVNRAGIVKAVDMARRVFYISTPVPQEQLQHVNILLQGRVEIPVPLLMVRDFRIMPEDCAESYHGKYVYVSFMYFRVTLYLCVA